MPDQRINHVLCAKNQCWWMMHGETRWMCIKKMHCNRIDHLPKTKTQRTKNVVAKNVQAQFKIEILSGNYYKHLFLRWNVWDLKVGSYTKAHVASVSLEFRLKRNDTPRIPVACSKAYKQSRVHRSRKANALLLLHSRARTHTHTQQQRLSFWT